MIDRDDEWNRLEAKIQASRPRATAPQAELIARTIEMLSDFRAALDRRGRDTWTIGDERRYSEASELMGELRPFAREET
jgi:hypothetical protein